MTDLVLAAILVVISANFVLNFTSGSLDERKASNRYSFPDFLNVLFLAVMLSAFVLVLGFLLFATFNTLLDPIYSD